jgi:hypothetical protein
LFALGQDSTPPELARFLLPESLLSSARFFY